MTDCLSRVREIALLLPGTEEVHDETGVEYRVAGTPFARLTGAGPLRLRDRDDGAWTDVTLDGADWTLVEDRVARSWERVAPAALLEAGGR